MKKTIIGLAGLVLLFGFGGVASAAVNAVTPSTNELNETKGWAFVEQTSKDVGSTELVFTSTRNHWSCFEHRSDNEANTVVGANPNTDITDGRWTQVCVNDSQVTKTIQANEFVDVRMVYGAETDERFDWTRFDVLPEPGAIVSPTDGEEIVQGDILDLEAYDLGAKSGGVQWAIREGTCSAGTSTVGGNVDGFSDPYLWTGGVFTASMSTSDLNLGTHCFIFNPTQGERLTQLFEIVEPEVVEPTDPTAKLQCKKGGWEDFGFKNQGQCIRFVETGKDSR